MTGGANETDDLLSDYSAAAPELIRRFEAISPSTLYKPVIDLLPVARSRILDIGAGTGRDAAWLADQGHIVSAVEPVDALRRAAMDLHGLSLVRWLAGSLPDLAGIEGPYDRILLSAVWQHLDDAARAEAMPRLYQLTASGGLVIMSIRHGPGAPGRPVHSTNIEETVHNAERVGFILIRRHRAESVQEANRAAGVWWTWLAFQAQ